MKPPIQSLKKGVLNPIKSTRKTAPALCETAIFSSYYQALETARRDHRPVALLGHSGYGKTVTIQKFKSDFPTTTVVTLNIVARQPRALLYLIQKALNLKVWHSKLNCVILDEIANALRESPRLLVLDEMHLASWEAWELVRALHDSAGIGIAVAGQPRMYDTMYVGGTRDYLYDQILSRISLSVSFEAIAPDDIQLFAQSVWPGLDKACVGFLTEEGNHHGGFRRVGLILEWAIRLAQDQDIPIDHRLLRRVTQILADRQY